MALKTSLNGSRHFRFGLGLILAAALLASCGGQATASLPAAATVVPATAGASQATPVDLATTASLPTATTPSAVVSAAPVDGLVSFSKDLAPILQASCVSCHGGERTSRALDLKTYASLMAGSQNGAVIVAGDAAKSLLIQKIQAGSMPKRGTKLTPDLVQLFVNWVNAGAKDN